MGKKIVKELTIRKHGHIFDFSLLDNGRIEYQIDKGKVFTVKELSEGKVYFVKKQELAIKNELVEIDSIELNADDYTSLKEAYDDLMREKQLKSTKVSNSTDNSLSRVDFWKKKIYTGKNEKKEKYKYCVHDFRIGNDKYRFVERNIPDIGIVINPDYKISDDVPHIGGVPKQYGELMFWDYFFEDKGWQRIRTLSNNELICLDIIQKNGYFSLGQPETKKKKGLFK